jgi:hypothetical protein
VAGQGENQQLGMTPCVEEGSTHGRVLSWEQFWEDTLEALKRQFQLGCDPVTSR